MKKTILIILLFISISSFSQNKNIKESSICSNIEKLSSDDFLGRESGKEGEKKAAEYIKNFFITNEVPKIGHSYFQEFIVKGKRYNYRNEKNKKPFIQRAKQKNNKIKGKNVIGFIEGTEKKEEVIVVSAHYDHLGFREEKIYNGADDNATGTAAVLEVSKALSKYVKEGGKLKRSVLFILMSAEEKGLIGSKHYTDNPIIPLKKTIANLNIDMIGRKDKRHEKNNYIYIIGSDFISKELHEINEKNNKKVGLELDYRYNNIRDPNRFYFRSDHYNFAKNDIPCIFYFSGVHEDYHQPTDTFEKIDCKKVQKISQLVFLNIITIANKERRLRKNKD
ncbi:MAG: peptidase M28 [Flavobacteriales bacterium]|nr:peptidase M28 [Flavobacteriales bacterium]